MMNIKEMREYLLEELKEEHQKMLMNKENHYSYIFMLCNDMGIIPSDQGRTKERAQNEKNTILQGVQILSMQRNLQSS